MSWRTAARSFFDVLQVPRVFDTVAAQRERQSGILDSKPQDLTAGATASRPPDNPLPAERRLVGHRAVDGCGLETAERVDF